MAHALGVAKSLPGIDKTLTEKGKQPFEGIALGQYQSRPLDMATAMSTLANQGVWHNPHFVQRVENAAGEVLYEHPEDGGERRVSSNVANNVLEAMEPVAVFPPLRPVPLRWAIPEITRMPGWSVPPRSWLPPCG